MNLKPHGYVVSAVVRLLILHALAHNCIIYSVEAEGKGGSSDGAVKAAPVEPVKQVLQPVAVSIEIGECLYQHNCAACHGPCGRGDGEARVALKIRPRDFREDALRFISAEDGVATNYDFARTVRYGRRDAQMPAFPFLLDEQIRSLELYVREMYRSTVVERLTQKLANNPKITHEKIETIATRQTKPGKEVAWSLPSKDFHADTAKGRDLFSTNCVACHGLEGRGDGPQQLKDDRDRPIKARDFTQGKLHGGSLPLEVYWRIRCGIPGTPMPAQKGLSDDEVWQLVNYVQHLSANR